MSIKTWNEDSILSRNGYAADGSQSDVHRHIKLEGILSKYHNDDDALFEVIEHFRWLMEDRGDRMSKANARWKADLEYFCRRMNQR